MQAGLVLLCLAYVLSQFFRAFLAVLSDALERDLGARPEDLAFASGLWFLSFALMQLPVGWLLDRSGPRRTAAALLLIGGGGGAALFALATTPAHINVAMFLIGIGCSPVLMASYYIFARQYPAARFATLAALMLGMGSIGNLVASYPMALAEEWLGWRGSLAGLSALSAMVAAGLYLSVKDPPRLETTERGSVLSLLRMPAIWLILPMMFVNYAPSGATRGLWIGPYLRDVFGLDTALIGAATLIMGSAMIVGTFCYGPLDRILGTRKWVVFWGNLSSACVIAALAVFIDASVWLSIALMAMIGFLGGCFPVIISHGRAFFPPHLVGQGVTLMNLFGIGGVGIMQFVSGRIHEQVAAGGGDIGAPYVAIFAFFAIALALGTAIYAFSRDNMN
jgi:MFS family permease